MPPELVARRHESGFGSPGGIAANPSEWMWCLNLRQPFSALLGVAKALTDIQQRPGEETMTGTPLLNAYLVVCALDQILSDHLDPPPYESAPAGVGRALRALARVHRARDRALALLSLRLRRRARMVRWLTMSLASRLAAGELTVGSDARRAISRLRRARWPLTLLRTRLDIPECFRGADLYPKDCEVLARRAAAGEDSGDGPALVIGVGTSGFYLAPLCASALRSSGRDVRVMSLRHPAALVLADRRRVRRLAAAGGWVMVVDISGQTASWLPPLVATLRQQGLPEPRICQVGLELEHAPSAPGAHGVWQVSLAPDDSQVGKQLADTEVERWLNRAHVLERLGADEARVTRSFQLRAGEPAPRVGSEAAQAAIDSRRRRPLGGMKVFEVELRREGHYSTLLVLGRCAGLGFFGYHSWLVAACLADHTPEVLGIHEGILFMRWEPGQGPPEPVEPDELDEIAAYVAARARRLDLGATKNLCSSEAEGSAARRAAIVLSRPLGARGVLVARRLAGALDREMKPSSHTLVDGRMGPAEWLRLGHSGLLKVDFDEHGFDPGHAGTTDPVHDLAGAALGFQLEPDEERRLLNAYAGVTSDASDLAARLLLHKLQIGTADVDAPSPPGPADDARSRSAFARDLAIRETLLTRSVNGYLAELFLRGLGSDVTGPLWVLRLEDVLETNHVGFDCATTAGAAALRALLAHGQQVVLATAHSIGELRERCGTFGLLGGIAEHGSVLWDARRQEAVSLVGREATRTLAELRRIVQTDTDLLVDPRHQHSLRLFRWTNGGRRGAEAGPLRDLMVRHGLGGLEVRESRDGTVVRADEADEAAACERLRSQLSADGSGTPLHVVDSGCVGLDLLRLGDHRYSPGNAVPELRQAKADLKPRILALPHQAGALALVRRALHGRRGTCPQCAPPRLTRADGRLAGLLGVQDRGRWGHLQMIARWGSLPAPWSGTSR